MLRSRRIPIPRIEHERAALGHGMDSESSPIDAKKGSARAAFNYEAKFGGGFERIGGFERFDGRTSPSSAIYSTLVLAAPSTVAAPGDTLTGQTSAASGTVIFVGTDAVGNAFIALTAVTGAFVPGETVLKGASIVGQNTAVSPAITTDVDNTLYGLAAELYRPLIQQPPGSGPIRGISSLGSTVFAWRDNAPVASDSPAVLQTTGVATVTDGRVYSYASESSTFQCAFVRSSTARSGKRYWEVSVEGPWDRGYLIGVMAQSEWDGIALDYPDNPYADAFWGICNGDTSGMVIGTINNGVASSNPPYDFNVGDIIGIAFDFDNGNIWFSRNGVWIAGDPATGASPTWSGLSAAMDPYIATYGPPATPKTWSYTCNFLPDDLAYAAPTGFLTFGDAGPSTSMVMFEASASGWQAVDIGREVSFTTSHTTQFAEGATITQGGVTATIRRVVVESGTFAGGTAAGRLIIGDVTGGEFAAGAATISSGGSATLGGASTAISLLPGGRVETVVHNFGGATGTNRIYGCDGVNPEFEFDGTVLVPLNTGMSTRAKFVTTHRGFLWYAFGSSLQKSSVMSPYIWSAVLGAAELATGDDITGLAKSTGNQESSTLSVACANSMHVLYGSSTATFRLDQIGEQAGASAYSVQRMSFAIGHDAQGFRVIRPTDTFGNFAWDIASQKVDGYVRNRAPVCSVFTAALSRYRCFFSDGSAMSGTPNGREIAWTPISYGIDIRIAYSAEVGGRVRTFYGSADGWVYEADIGRSFDGQPIVAALRVNTMDMGNAMMEKRFRDMEVEALSAGAFTLYATAEPDDGSSNNDLVAQTTLSLPGAGGQYDVSNWDASRWDAGSVQRKVIEVPCIGYGIAPLFFCNSAVELPHTLRSLSVLYSPTKVRKS